MSNRNATVTVNTKANTSGLKQATDSIRGFDSGLKGTLGNLKQFRGALTGLAVVGIAKGIKSVADDMYDAFKVQWLAEKNINDALYSNMTARGASQKEIDNEVKAYKDLASAQQQVGVIGDEVTLSGMGIMTQMGLTAKQVKDMTPLLQDLAVKQYGLNVSGEQYKQVSQSVATMVNMGKLTLQGYGIQVTDTERKQFKAMSQSERYSFVMNKLKNSVAGANEEMAKTTGGKIQQMNNAIGDCEEKVGALVNAIYGGFATMALPIINDVTGSFQEFMNVMSDSDQDSYSFLSDDTVNTLAGIRDGCKEIYNNISSIFGTSGDFGSNFGLTDGLLAIVNNLVAALKAASEWAKTLDDQLRGSTENGGGLLDSISAGISLATQFSPFGVVKQAGKAVGIGKNATGTNYWQGGLTRVNENGGEIMNLPNGTQIIPHDVSTKMAASNSSNITVNVNVAGNMVGNDAFIDEMGAAISNRISLALSNM